MCSALTLSVSGARYGSCGGSSRGSVPGGGATKPVLATYSSTARLNWAALIPCWQARGRDAGGQVVVGHAQRPPADRDGQDPQAGARAAAPAAACLMRAATAAGCERYTEWLAATSVTAAPARSDMKCCAGGGIMRSCVVSRYQLGLIAQAGSVILPPRASTPHGTCESAMKAACSAGRSAANEAWNLSRSRNKNPSAGGRIGGSGAPGGGLAMSVFTDSPWSGANAAI